MIGEALEPFSLYIHIPFCTHICGYCHFYVLPEKEASKTALLKALEQESSLYAPFFHGKQCVSIYFGGGTPSLFGPERVAQLLKSIHSVCVVSDLVEISLEVNPEEASQELFLAYAQAGINRISIGVQSFDNSLLSTLTRRHTAQDSQNAVINAAQAGIKKISIDLMYDIPKQTRQHWRSTLDTALDLPVSHLSLYNLTIEPHTPFDRKRAALEAKRPLPRDSRAMYEEAIFKMEQKDWKHYEISAFGLQGEISIHNIGYWLGRPFLGLGPSAYSYWKGARFRNVANLKEYCLAIAQGKRAVDFFEELDQEAAHRESLIVRLRTSWGVEIEPFQQQYGPFSAETLSSFRLFEQRGWMKEEQGRVYLTLEGKLFYDSIAVELV